VNIQPDFCFVGQWNNTLTIFDRKRKYQTIQFFKTKAAVRTLCHVQLSSESSIMLVGENDGWLEVLQTTSAGPKNSIEKMKIKFS